MTLRLTTTLLLGMALAMALTGLGAAPLEGIPTRDDEVLETLPPRVRGVQTAGQTPAHATPQGAAQAARSWITLARQSADPRYLGRAQAVLAPWWDSADAPLELAVLQATIEQSRHAFDAARSTLQRSLARAATLNLNASVPSSASTMHSLGVAQLRMNPAAGPAQAQAWLTLATLERVASRYDAAEAACAEVARHGAALYASACQLETLSMTGQHGPASEGLRQLARQATDTGVQAWLLSLLAENHERAGHDEAAAQAYQASLGRSADGYTALAYADLLLRLKQPSAALNTLADQVVSDAVLLRRAYAHKQLGNSQWRGLTVELGQRFAALDARGDDPSLHARDRALAALWLEDNPAKAWPAAQANLQLQKEPLDWWLALHAAQGSAGAQALAQLVSAFQRSGLRDARLARWQSGQGGGRP